MTLCSHSFQSTEAVQVPMPISLRVKLLILAFLDYSLSYSWETFLRARFPAACPPQKGRKIDKFCQNEREAVRAVLHAPAHTPTHRITHQSPALRKLKIELLSGICQQ